MTGADKVGVLNDLTLGAALRIGAKQLTASQTPLLDARILLKKASGLTDAGLIARSEEPMTQDMVWMFAVDLKRRTAGEPIAYITGVKEFWSLEFKVEPGVLIPRDDSECLIETVLARRERDEALCILDLGVGSGCLLCALLSEMLQAIGTGVDQSPAALKIAQANAEQLGFESRASFIVSDWAAALRGPFDVIIANPPYIPDGDRPGLPADVADYEPGEALFAGADGFDAYRAILTDISRVLAPDGLLVFEAGDGQAAQLADMVTKTFPSWRVEVFNDLKGRPRGVFADGKSFAKKD